MENIRDILIRGEDSKIQFKRRFDSADSLAAEICAMANSEGGLILVGVSDDGKAVGIDDLEKTNQRVSNACSQKIEPPASVMTENVLFEGKRLLLVKVQPGADKPHAANKGDFRIKAGSDKRRAGRADLKILMQASGAFRADELPVFGAGLSDLDRYGFERFCERNCDFIKPGIQVVRNPILVSFAGRIGIPYRGIGSGIVRIIRECRKARLLETEFAGDKVGRLFKATLRRPRG